MSLFAGRMFRSSFTVPRFSTLLKETRRFCAQFNYYKELEVTKSSSPEEIKKAYKKMARKYHPDGTEGDTEKFKRIVEAYQVLSDGEKRRDYDRTTQGPFKQNYQEYYSSTQQEQQDFEDLEDIFSHFGFGSFGGHKEEAFDDFFDFRTNRSSRSKKNSPKPKKKKKKNGSKVTVHMSLSFMEAVHGTTRDVTFTADAECRSCNATGSSDGKAPGICKTCNGSGTKTKVKRSYLVQTPCGDCGGTGERVTKPCSFCSGSGKLRKRQQVKVEVPPGIDDGGNIRVKGKGNVGENGGTTGDLIVEVKLLSHPIFTRNNEDIHSNHDISITDAIFGTTIDVPTISGNATVYVKSGTKHGDESILRGQGIQLKEKSFGNHIIHWNINIPNVNNLTDKQKALMKEFEKEELNKASS